MVRELTNDKIGLSIPKSEDVSGPSTSVNCVKSVQSIAQTGALSPAVTSYLGAAIADNSRRAYQADLRDFLRWGGAIPCSPETLAAYVADRAATLSPHTISRRVVGISRAHTSQGLPDPAKNDLVRTVLRGIRRSHGTAQRQAAPLVKNDLISLLPHMHGTKGLRDRALLLLGFSAALRRSELVALDVRDLEFVREGLIVWLRRSKTDQESAGRRIAVPRGRSEVCAVMAVQQWLKHAQIVGGPVFRGVSKGGQVADQRLTAQSVSLVIKALTEAAGLPSDKYSGHSLRAGLVTSAAQVGVATHLIMAQSGHRSMEMLNRYIREANLFVGNAAGALL